MEKYLVLTTYRETKRDQLAASHERFNSIRRSLLSALNGLGKTESLCKLLIAQKTKLPGIGQEAQHMHTMMLDRQAEMRKALNELNVEIKSLNARVSRLESEEYENENRKKAVDQAVQYADIILETHKQQQQRINDTVKEQLRDLRMKDVITTEDVEELAEKVKEVSEETPKIPSDLLESIRRFGKAGKLKTTKESGRQEETRDELVKSLAEAMAKRREQLEGKTG